MIVIALVIGEAMRRRRCCDYGYRYKEGSSFHHYSFYSLFLIHGNADNLFLCPVAVKGEDDT